MSTFIPRDVAPQRVVYAAGLLLLGAVSLAFRDFALQWQPVPAMLPHRAAFASVNALVLIGCGIVLLTPHFRTAAWLATAYLVLWVVLLHGPPVVASPLDVALWLGAAEITTLALGAAATVAARPSTHRLLRYAFATCVGIFGLSHFVYAQFTASLVPAWIPGPLFWAYATGVGHLATSASLFSGVMLRASMRLLTVMLAIITLLVQVPQLIVDPSIHARWVALAVSIALTGTAWLLSTVLHADELPAAVHRPASSDVIPS